MGELLDHFDYAKIYIYISLSSIVITFIANYFFKNQHFVRYIPGLILIGVGLYGLFGAIKSTDQSDGVNRLALFVIGIGGGIVGLLTGLIIGVLRKRELVNEKNRA